ncbi:hypothetical protein CMV_002665 [Castanea mollissima]|uniref:Uncharacterized protein n=1 Tax=Castanea mollissima TaxID=60419 RepID=A0A8J4RVQ9_9ROSI|nr:hypothetical protein CMV_002665 [Castanea mollissima]
MAFPGYVAQPQLGLGNSEMTWLPVLAGPAGALGVTYCSPYIVDSAYYARPSGRTSSVGASSKENNLNMPNNEWKPSQRPELASDEFGQRRKKPCRQVENLVFECGINCLRLANKVLRYGSCSNKQIKAFLQALCDLQLLFWSTLVRNRFHDILVIYDKHLLMLH